MSLNALVLLSSLKKGLRVVRGCGQKVGPDWVQDWSPHPLTDFPRVARSVAFYYENNMAMLERARSRKGERSWIKQFPGEFWLYSRALRDRVPKVDFAVVCR